MRRKQWTKEQILEVLRAAEAPGVSIGEVCRIYGMDPSTFHKWKRRYQAGLVIQNRDLRQLERENTRLKQLLATRDLELDALRRTLQKNSFRHSNGGKR